MTEVSRYVLVQLLSKLHMGDNSLTPDFLKCPCDRCGNPIEFPSEGIGMSVPCPHCSEETLLRDANLGLSVEPDHGTIEDTSVTSVHETKVATSDPPQTVRIYRLPPLSLLRDIPARTDQSEAELHAQAKVLQQILSTFGIDSSLGNITPRSLVTRYELKPASNVRLEQIVALHASIAACLGRDPKRVKILAPIPGKNSVGIEVDNPHYSKVVLKEVLDSCEWLHSQARIPLAIGLNAIGDPLVVDLADMPHLLIAGTTGSGKSVCIHAILTSLLFKFSPAQLQLVLIDSKLVELQAYNALPNLLFPVASSGASAVATLQLVVEEMERRVQKLIQIGARDIHEYNSRLEANNQVALPENRPRSETPNANWSLIVVVIDGLADLAGTSQWDDVDLRIRQIVRSGSHAGVHLIVSTSQPDQKVIGCLVDRSLPARIAFRMSVATGQRHIFAGLETSELSGTGEFLYLPSDGNTPIRAQAALVLDPELHGVINFISAQSRLIPADAFDSDQLEPEIKEDEQFVQRCIELIASEGDARTSFLQRRLHLGYSRASRILDELQLRGVVGPSKGAEPREILISPPEPDPAESLIEISWSVAPEDLATESIPPNNSVVESAPPPATPKWNRGAELRWIPAHQTIELGHFQIGSGLLYVSDGQAATEEASAINTRLPIGQPAIGAAAKLSYYSQYRWLSPEQRAAYLAWLAAGRRDANPAERELGYVFLFIYGLERRLLVDKAPDQEAIAEIVALLHTYGPFTRSASLNRYCGQLIHFWGWQQGVEYYTKLLEWIRALPVSLLGRDEMAIVLAGCLELNAPLDVDLAYELSARQPESRRSNVISRVNEEFRALFSKRYLERFPGGMKLQSGARPARLNYRPCSPTLLQWGHNDIFITVPDVLGLASQFNRLPKIWNSCVEDLADYSRARAKPADTSSKLKAHLALPEDLRAGKVHPLAELWNEIISRTESSDGYHILDVEDAIRLTGLSKRPKLSLGQSRELAETIDSLGFGIEPDARHDAAYLWNQQIAVFKPTSGKFTPPTQAYLGAAALLKLCVLVAGADGHVNIDELDVARNFIEKNLVLTPGEHQRFTALEKALIADPATAKSSLNRVAKGVPIAQRAAIGEVLVYVAAADAVITKDELRALERIFKAFEIGEAKLDEYLRAIQPQLRSPSTVIAGEGGSADAVPSIRPGFAIDMALVDRIAKETSEVIGILAQVMVDEEPEAGIQKVEASEIRTSPNPLSTAPASAETPAWLRTLELKYHPILLRLLEQASWTKTEFAGLAKSSQLMPLNVFDAINEWADEHLGDFLLEGDDPILVHRELIK